MLSILIQKFKYLQSKFRRAFFKHDKYECILIECNTVASGKHQAHLSSYQQPGAAAPLVLSGQHLPLSKFQSLF